MYPYQLTRYGGSQKTMKMLKIIFLECLTIWSIRWCQSYFESISLIDRTEVKKFVLNVRLALILVYLNYVFVTPPVILVLTPIKWCILPEYRAGSPVSIHTKIITISQGFTQLWRHKLLLVLEVRVLRKKVKI